jgi:prefoldin alpha subunit
MAGNPDRTRAIGQGAGPVAPPSGPEMDQHELQEAMLVGEALQGDLRALEEQRALLDSVLRDLRRGRETLDGIRDAAPGHELLVPVGAGVFVRASLVDGEKVLASVGAGVVLESTREGALARLDERIASAEQAAQRTTEEARRIEGQLSELNARLSEIAPRE